MKKKVLLIGIAPEFVDVSALSGMTQEKLAASLKREEQSLRALGFDAHWCLTDLGKTAGAVVQAELAVQSYDLILIGAGVRVIPARFALFEQLINIVHEHAPKSKLCFNTNPDDTEQAVLRWLTPPSKAN